MSFHVRRKDREITDPKALMQVLKSANYVTVALCMDNEPYLVALSHGYDETANCLYFHCAPEGKKLVYAKANPNVWGQAMLGYRVSDDCDYEYTSVHFQGTLSIIETLEEKQHAMKVLIWHQSSTPEAKLAKIKPETLTKLTMGKITLTALTGKQHLKPDKFPRKVN